MKRKVGNLVVTIERGRRDDTVGIGARWSAQVDGHVAVLVATPFGLLVGTSRGVVSRLETVTGRQCASYQAGAAIDELVVADKLVTVRAGAVDTVLLLRSLKVPKRRSESRIA